ncbi:hypothetical protein [Vibrio sp. PNB22_4_1]
MPNYMKTFAAILVALLLLPISAFAATDSRGKEFVVAFPKNYQSQGSRVLHISSQTEATGTVSVPGLSFVESFSLAANEVKKIVLPIQVESMARDAVSQRGIRIVADADVSVYGLSQQRYTTDAYLGLPVDSLGVNYVIPSYEVLSSSYPSQLTVVAAYDGTTITVTPTVQAGSRAAGQPFTVTLNRDETYYLESNLDLTGTEVNSDLPIAVFGGNNCANVPRRSSACDHLVEMVPAISTWGKSFLTYPLATRRNGEVFRVIASEDNTDIIINGSVVSNIQAGAFYETVLTSQSIIESNNPVLVVQYSPGSSFDGVRSDPFMMIIPPSEQFLDEYTFTTLGADSGFSNGFVSVVIPTDDVESLTLDGELVDSSIFAPIGISGYSGAQLPLTQGSYRLEAAVPFGIYVYGFGNYDSYGYTGGMAFEFINPKGDRFFPHVELIQLGTSIQGLAGDSEDVNLNGILDEGEDLNQNQIIDRRTEDLNGNDVLDEGEDVNQDGVLDVDTGIFRITLSEDAQNLTLDTSSFVPGSLHVNFKISLLDESIAGTGTLIVSDGAGNKVERDIVLNNTPTMTDVTVISHLSTRDIDLDLTSFAKQPDRVDQRNDMTVLEWDFVNFSIAQQAKLDYDLVVTNLRPNEVRVVTQDLILEYTNVDGERIRNELGSQNIEVANSVFDFNADIDKSIYISGEYVHVSGDVLNLSTFPADASLQLYIKDEDGNVVATLQDITIEQLMEGAALAIEDAFFDTSGIMLGNYEVVAVLTDQLSGVPIEVTRPFVVTAENGQLADVQSSIQTDKAVYNQWDSVEIDVTAQNIANYSTVDNAMGYLSITRPNQVTELVETIQLSSLSSQLLRERQFNFNLDRAAVGSYDLLWEVRNAENQTLAASQTTIDVEAMIAASLVGEVTLEKSSIYYAQDNGCSVELSNRGTASIAELPVRVTVANVDTEVTVKQETFSQTLAPLEQSTQSFDFNTRIPSGNYACVVETKVDDQWLPVGADTFELMIDIALIDRVGSALVLQDGEIAADDIDPFGPSDVTLRQQREVIVRLLEAEGWQVTYLTDETEFVSALLTDKYDLVLVAQERSTLQTETQRLLNYHVFLGDGALVSQGLPDRQPLLTQMLGVDIASLSPNVTGLALDDIELSFAYLDSVRTFHPNGALEVAGYTMSDPSQQWQYTDGKQCLITDNPPAMSWHQFGRGHTSYSGFDLFAQAVSPLYAGLFSDTIESVYQTQHEMWLGKAKPITLTVSSDNSPVPGQLELVLSSGLTLVDSGPFIEKQGIWTWAFDLEAEPVNRTTITVIGKRLGTETLSLTVVSGTEDSTQVQEVRTLPISVTSPYSLVEIINEVELAITESPRNLPLRLAQLELEKAYRALLEGNEHKAAQLIDGVIDSLQEMEPINPDLLSLLFKQRLLLSPIQPIGTCLDDDDDDDDDCDDLEEDSDDD